MHRLILLAVSFSFGWALCLAQPGKPDPSFGINGVVTNDSVIFVATAIQTDGKIVAAGIAGVDFAVVRYNTNGSPDSTFSGDGLELTHFRDGTASATSIAIQSDGKIVVAGSVSIAGGQNDFAAARYNVDGSLDLTFSGHGKQVYQIGAAYTFANAVAIQRNGRIILAGYSYALAAGDADFTLARLNSDGSLDKTFSGDGKVTTNFHLGDNDYIQSVIIQPDEKIVAAGYTGDNINMPGYNKFALARYTVDGSLDSTFNGDGKQTSDFGIGANGYAVTLQSDGKILETGRIFSAVYDFALARFNVDGSVDRTFSADGKQTTGLGGEAKANAIAVEENGRIIVAGNVKDPASRLTDFALAAYRPDGILDSAFGANGIEVTSSVAAYDQIAGLAITKHTLYAAGFASRSQFSKSFGVIVRYFLDYPGELPPAVRIISPANDATYLSGANVHLDATASDTDGVIRTVAFYNGATLLYTAINAPYSFTWPHVPKGSYTIIARATDNSGLVSADSINITVVPNTGPTVTITNPSDGQTFLKGATLHLQAIASDTDGRVASVAFYSGATLLKTEYKAPYTVDWTIGQTGTYFITARAADNWGAVTVSSPVNIVVVPNEPPIVSIVSPTDGKPFLAPATINLEAAAADPDGRIAQVNFYSGSTLLTSEHKAPYTYGWKNVLPGLYTVTAVAKDNWSAETTSAPVTITVLLAPGDPVLGKQSTVGTNLPLHGEPGLKLLPNPVKTVLHISITGVRSRGASTVSVISAAGVVRKTLTVTGSSQTMHLDVSSLVSGTYVLKIASGDKVMYRQFVKL